MRSAVFWVHLVLGLGAGLVLGMQAVTGVVLAYEPTLLASLRPSPTASTWTAFAPKVRDLDFRRWQLRREEGCLAAQGQLADGRLLDFPAATVEPATVSATERSLAMVKEIHRWFGVEGPLRERAKIITGASAAILVALLLSGLFLWWPRSRAAWRPALAFPRRSLPRKAWWRQLHLAVGFWLLLPLLIVALTGTILAFPDLLGPKPQPGSRSARGPAVVKGFPQAAVDRLTALAPHWTELDLRATQEGGWQARIRPAEDAPAFAQDSVELSPQGEAQPLRRYADQDGLRKIRAWIRYAHTGEAFGLWGQTLALLSSLALLLLIGSGVTLSLLRLRSSLTRPSTV